MSALHFLKYYTRCYKELQQRRIQNDLTADSLYDLTLGLTDDIDKAEKAYSDRILSEAKEETWRNLPQKNY